MPNADFLERFDKILNTFGNEYAIASDRDEDIEPVKAPDPSEFADTISSEDFLDNLAHDTEQELDIPDPSGGEDSPSFDDTEDMKDGAGDEAQLGIDLDLDDFGFGDIDAGELGGNDFDFDDLGSSYDLPAQDIDQDAAESDTPPDIDTPPDTDTEKSEHSTLPNNLSDTMDAGAMESNAMDAGDSKESAAYESAYKIDDADFAALKKNLADLPLNLRIEIAGVISSNKYPVEIIKNLISSLVRQLSAYELARRLSRIVGKRIVVPRSYEKQSGVQFEKEQDTFSYKFRTLVWPILRLFLVGTVLVSVLGVIAYWYVYQPLRARNIYVQGLESVELQEYERANYLFDQAYNIWPANKRFFDYAQAFREERQFSLAREKYETLLSADIDPLNRNGILEFGNFSTYVLRDYETSLEYLDRFLADDPWDYEALLGRGDAFLEWGMQFDTAEMRDELFEQARFTYASLIGEYGETDELLFRMLRYFILTEKVEEILELENFFLSDANAELDPYGLTMLTGFLLDLAQSGAYGSPGSADPVEAYIDGLTQVNSSSRFLDDAFRVLNMALEISNEIPDLHYYRARYSREVDDLQGEITALKNARELYEELRRERPLNRVEIAREIDTYIREGEVFYRLGELLSAESSYRRAIDLYTQAIAARKVQPEPMFGRVYANLGDIYYFHASDYETAEELYLLARTNSYGSITEFPERFQERQELAYKLGFIHLFQASFLIPGNVQTEANRQIETERQDVLDKAITEFNIAQGVIPTANLNLLYARANTQYMRQNYYDASSLYQILLNELTTERVSISTFLLEEDDQHTALIDYQIRVNNNLGVTFYRLYEQVGESGRNFFARSQLFLSRSTELAENLARDNETAVRADTRPLAYLNLARILAPEFIGDVQIDPDIRKDLKSATF
ncbi:MAG: periplasmic flagellar collar protein FlcA [Salinispira sp.]